MTVIAEWYPTWRDLSVHESSPGGPLSEKLQRECEGYVGSHFYEDVELGTTARGFRCEDLTKQTFADACFDMVVTSDVFEHVFEADRAFKEIKRTLKPGGAHVFTLPWYRDKLTVARAVKENGGIVHLLPPDYHGNPISDDGSLVVTEWGTDFPELLRQWTGTSVAIIQKRDRHLGIDGEFREVFVQRKPAL